LFDGRRFGGHTVIFVRACKKNGGERNKIPHTLMVLEINVNCSAVSCREKFNMTIAADCQWLLLLSGDL
jgi:hypothetical protein